MDVNYIFEQKTENFKHTKGPPCCGGPMVKYIRMYYDVINRGSLLQLQINVSSDVEHYTYSIRKECKNIQFYDVSTTKFWSGAKKGFTPDEDHCS